MSVRYVDAVHDCDQPDLGDNLGDVSRAEVRWRCPECGQRWWAVIRVASATWGRRGKASRRWRRQQRARLDDAAVERMPL